MFIATPCFLLVGYLLHVKLKPNYLATVLKAIIYLLNIDIKPYFKFSTTKIYSFQGTLDIDT